MYIKFYPRSQNQVSSLQDTCWLVILWDYTNQYIEDSGNPVPKPSLQGGWNPRGPCWSCLGVAFPTSAAWQEGSHGQSEAKGCDGLERWMAWPWLGLPGSNQLEGIQSWTLPSLPINPSVFSSLPTQDCYPHRNPHGFLDPSVTKGRNSERSLLHTEVPAPGSKAGLNQSGEAQKEAPAHSGAEKIKKDQEVVKGGLAGLVSSGTDEFSYVLVQHTGTWFASFPSIMICHYALECGDPHKAQHLWSFPENHGGHLCHILEDEHPQPKIRVPAPGNPCWRRALQKLVVMLWVPPVVKLPKIWSIETPLAPLGLLERSQRTAAATSLHQRCGLWYSLRQSPLGSTTRNRHCMC